MYEAMREDALREHFGDEMGGADQITQRELIVRVYEEHRSMCLQVWRHYPMELDEVLSNPATANWGLNDELKRPKELGYPSDQVEFLLERVVGVLVSANSGEDSDPAAITEQLLKRPWERGD